VIRRDFLSIHNCWPARYAFVDPDPELQVRHRRSRGRAMVHRDDVGLKSGDDGITAMAGRDRSEITPTVRIASSTLTSVRQALAEPT